MPKLEHSGSSRPESQTSGDHLTTRVLQIMAVVVGIALGISLPFSTWRVTAGLFVGGILSLLNFHWMRNSVAAAFSVLAGGERPRIGLAQYILRYLVIVAVVFGGYKMNVISVPATIVGLSSFVVALFAEALRESYFILTHREGIN